MAKRRRATREAPKAKDYIKEEEEEFEEDSEEEEDEEPRGRRASGHVGRGWGASREKRSRHGSRFPVLKFKEDEPVLLAFMEDEPFAAYAQHWVPAAQGKKSFVCLEDRCPLCDAGDDPSPRAAFNVVVLVQGQQDFSEPSISIWDTPITVTDKLESLNADKRKGPLTDGYWEVEMSKEGRTTYNIAKVKEDDVEPDWEVDPLYDDEFEALEKDLFSDEKFPKRDPKSVLEDAADDITTEDEEEEDEEPRRGRRRGKSSGGRSKRRSRR